MSNQLDKQKFMEWLRTHKNSYTATWNNNLNADVIDRSAVRIELMEYITKEIISGTLDIEPMEHEKAYWAREGLIERLEKEIKLRSKIVDGLAIERHDLINECDALKDDVFTLNSSLELAVKETEDVREFWKEASQEQAKEYLESINAKQEQLNLAVKALEAVTNSGGLEVSFVLKNLAQSTLDQIRGIET